MSIDQLKAHTMELLSITEDIPTLPDRFLKIQQVINDPDSSSGDIGRIIQTDQATTVMVMKVANSPAFNPMNRTVKSLSQAITRLGTRETADISLSMSLLYGFAIPGGIAAIRAFWAHAYGVAVVSKHFTTLVQGDAKLPHQDTMFVAGLLHDIGKAILGIRVDLSYFEKPEFRVVGQSLIRLEKERYGMDHAEVGEVILRQWGMSNEIAEVVGRHHDDSRGSGTLATTICQLADRFAHQQLKSFNSIETVYTALSGGLLQKSEALLVKEGLISPPEEQEERAEEV